MWTSSFFFFLKKLSDIVSWDKYLQSLIILMQNKKNLGQSGGEISFVIFFYKTSHFDISKRHNQNIDDVILNQPNRKFTNQELKNEKIIKISIIIELRTVEIDQNDR